MKELQSRLLKVLEKNGSKSLDCESDRLAVLNALVIELCQPNNKAALEIIPNDEDVENLNPESQEMLKCVIDYFDLKENVTLYETLHGHIAKMQKKDFHFVPGSEGEPARLGEEQLSFLSKLCGFRWVEATADTLQIGFTNSSK